MNIEALKDFLLWSMIANYAILLVWLLALSFARHAIYRLHARWFRLTLETFDTIHYAAMAAYKIGILLFNLVPLLVLMWAT